MSQPETALILPISDISLNRDQTKLRLAGIITAINPQNSSIVVLSDPFPSPSSDTTQCSILVDLSLCISNNGWKRGNEAKLPKLKSKLMVIGHLTRREVGMEVGWVTNSGKEGRELVEPQLRTSLGEGERGKWMPNKYFILEAILVKPLDEQFDLALWNTAARMRSQNEWSHYHTSLAQSRTQKGKRKAEF